MPEIRSFRELRVYQLARTEAKKIFVMTRRFPREEMYALTDQIRRSSRAVGAMLAEAWARRRYEAAFINKTDEALAEATETQAWLDHALECATSHWPSTATRTRRGNGSAACWRV
jgi:four helix bundle protein